MVETEVAAFQSNDRNYAVALLRCIITGQLNKCIRVKLCDIPWEVEGEPQVAEIYGQFSAEGLRSLLTDLEAAPDPLTLPTPDEIRQGNPYQWVAVYEGGESVRQFEGAEEVPLALVDFPRVKELWVAPRYASLPSFGLIKGEGFVYRESPLHPHESLDLPSPEGDFQWNYYRRVSLTFTNCVGENELWPTQVKQVLGWQVGSDENACICEIAIEDEGSWQVYKKQNL